MSYKRSRSTFEADNQPATAAPFATFGTPLPYETDARDDGSYVPIWKQDVRDDKGRRRLHGAFTGGWSAGYFNTVGSKEGWTPSTFVSSRSNRRKDESAKNTQRPEDYMDEEDLADAAEAQKVQTSQAFAGLGAGLDGDGAASQGLLGIFKTQGDTMGYSLLRKMGWRDGQGIGPKIRRSARLDMKTTGTGTDETHLFAPDDVPMIHFNRKSDQKGLGYEGEARLAEPEPSHGKYDEEDKEPGTTRERFSLLSSGKSKPTKKGSNGIGVGILNDDGSDEEDPYEVGPKIKYNRVIGGNKKKKSKKSSGAVSNPSLGNAPVFVPKTARASNSLQRCHDGRLPIDGFVLAKLTEDLGALMTQYAPPQVPEDWVSARHGAAGASTESSYLSAADAAKASTLDPKSRAALLGEKALPGKSVFDYISSSARDKLAAASGKTNLPQGRGEIPEQYRLTEEEKKKRVWDQVPKLDADTALAALSRSSGGPYADDEDKRGRYKEYLENQADGTPIPIPKPASMTDEEYLREMNEFYNCARIFKPMTGFMASRFTAAKATIPGSSGGVGTEDMELLSQPEPKASTDPAEEAAKMGMYGKMTRSVHDFYPTRLLCKRFNVKPPATTQPGEDKEGTAQAGGGETGFAETSFFEGSHSSAPASAAPAPAPTGATREQPALLEAPPVPAPDRDEKVDPERNGAVEASAAHAEVLRAIFGDSDSE